MTQIKGEATCDKCGCDLTKITTCIVFQASGEVLCDNCDQNQAEAEAERYNERLMGGEIETEHEKYLKAWEEKQKAHKR